jgi:predicted DNA-binding mobile mystery protein A
MNDAIRHLDKRLAGLRPLAKNVRPPKGWLRAVRDALGMTTAQLANRIGVTQPRIIELEKAEVSGAVTLHSLQRAAEAMGCRVVYALVPDRPLAEIVRARTELVADRQLASVRHTMSLEDQAVVDNRANEDLRRRLREELLRRPARLWDEK